MFTLIKFISIIPLTFVFVYLLLCWSYSITIEVPDDVYDFIIGKCVHNYVLVFLRLHNLKNKGVAMGAQGAWASAARDRGAVAPLDFHT